MDLIKLVEDTLIEKKELPSFKAGDTVTVYYKIIEGAKERIQQYQGVVLQRRGVGASQDVCRLQFQKRLGTSRAP